MRRIVDPRQNCLFDPYGTLLTEATRRRLLEGWPGVFRHVILELMPVDVLSGHFSPKMGRPTRELYSMAGLVLLMECMNWTKQQAVDAYSFHLEVQYALNLEPVAQDLSMRTLERYIQHFEQNDLAGAIMHTVTGRLVTVLGTKIDQQRLDSTHVFSDMACVGRTRLMGVAIKRFLTQVKRHDPAAYANLDDLLRQRYAPSVHRLFAETGKGSTASRLLRQQVAEDMYQLIRQFAERPDHAKRSSYQAMERIFHEQCDVQEQTVEVKAKTGSDVMQNPSDPEATYDGHKGPGYQVQLCETCHQDNEQQLIVGALPQTAAETDAASLEPMLESLEVEDLLPDQMLGDTQYTRDENVQRAEAFGVELVGPVPGAEPQQPADHLCLDDFVIDERTEQVIRCPHGQAPIRSVHDPATGKTRTMMPESACGRCAYRHRCPVTAGRDGGHLVHTAKQRRVAVRRRQQATEAFRQRYRRRSGIEATNSGLKRRMGLGRLRVRGRPSVFRAIYLKVAGWNILRASVCAAVRAFVYAKTQTAVSGVSSWLWTAQNADQRLVSGLRRVILAFHGPFPHFSTRVPAA
jgi:hypothetical protein